MPAKPENAPKQIQRADYSPPDWLIDEVELYFNIGEQDVEVRSKLHLRRNPAIAAHTRALVLNGRQLSLLHLAVDGRSLNTDEYQLSDTSLSIDALPETSILEIRTSIDPSSNTSLEGLYAAGDMLCTQCEAHGFSRISYHLDRPDVLAKFNVTIEADSSKYPVLLSNGDCVEQTELSNGRQRVQWQDPYPKPCYLFALVAGDLARVSDSYTTSSGREVALEFYVEHGREQLCDQAIHSLKLAMAWDEDTYGLEYDLDTYMVVAVSSFNMGAMENKGLNVFNDRFVLASSDSATDADYELITAIIGHEYFHNWTGNRVTCRDWFQLSLKEGLTVFREQQFMQDCVGGSTQRIEQVRMLRERQFPEDAGPLAHPVRPDSYIEINNFYTATVYEKGAELVRMLHGMLGQENFAKALRNYLHKHDGEAATIEDFVAAMQAETTIDLQSFFAWYSQAGTPRVSVEDNYDEDSQRYQLKLHQQLDCTANQNETQPLLIPLNTALLGQSEQLDERLITLTSAEQQLDLGEYAERPTPVLLRGFSAPVELSYAYTSEQLINIVRQESDGYSRWEAMQRLYTQHVIEGGEAQTILTCCAELLDGESDNALLAELLSAPTENQLIDQNAAGIDIDTLIQRRDALLEALGSQLAPQLQSKLLPLQESDSEPRDPSYSVASAAQRRLHAVALHLLLRAATPERQTLASSYYKQAVNMTEHLAALAALRDVDCVERDSCLADFRARWDGNALVLDKWFALQACTSFGNAAERVRQLMQDPTFMLSNPNRVRSLIGAFAMNNPRGLHAADSSGYTLMAEFLPQLDQLNPQVSARMAQVFSRWRLLDESRQTHIKSLLDTLLRGNLSSDLFEIITKIRGDTKLT